MAAQRIGDIIGRRELARVAPSATISAACQVFDRLNVGAAVVLDEQKLVGILCERDVIRKCICQSRRADETMVSAVMTRNPTVIEIDGNVSEALHLMRQGQYRHLPVMSGNQVVGVLSLREIPVENYIIYERYYDSLQARLKRQ